MLKGRLAVVHSTTELCIQPGDPVMDAGEFPRYERVIPEESKLRPGLMGNFQATFLVTLQAAVKVLKTSKGYAPPLNFFHVDGVANGTGVARTALLEEFVAVVLPLHETAPDRGLPGWVGAAQKAFANAKPAQAAA
jgi:hypothetical protein